MVIQSFCTLEHGLDGFMRVGCKLGRAATYSV